MATHTLLINATDELLIDATHTLLLDGLFDDATGTWASTEPTDVMAFSSAPSGVWGSIEVADTFAGVGHPSLFGEWHSTEAADTWFNRPALDLDGHATGGNGGTA